MSTISLSIATYIYGFLLKRLHLYFLRQVTVTLENVPGGIKLFKTAVRQYCYMQNACARNEEVFKQANRIAAEIEGIHPEDPRQIRASGFLVALVRSILLIQLLPRS